MNYSSQEVVRSSFYNDLKEYALAELKEFNPHPDITPIPDYKEIIVDWSLDYNNHTFYLFGVQGSGKAKDAAIALLEFKKVELPFISLIAHENIGALGRKELTYLTKNADKQYPTLSDFKEGAPFDIKRLAA